MNVTQLSHYYPIRHYKAIKVNASWIITAACYLGAGVSFVWLLAALSLLI